MTNFFILLIILNVVKPVRTVICRRKGEDNRVRRKIFEMMPNVVSDVKRGCRTGHFKFFQAVAAVNDRRALSLRHNKKFLFYFMAMRASIAGRCADEINPFYFEINIVPEFNRAHDKIRRLYFFNFQLFKFKLHIYIPSPC